MPGVGRFGTPTDSDSDCQCTEISSGSSFVPTKVPNPKFENCQSTTRYTLAHLYGAHFSATFGHLDQFGKFEEPANAMNTDEAVELENGVGWGKHNDEQSQRYRGRTSVLPK
jgi:hypothetical protein